MSILKRSLAPIVSEAWDAIDDQARKVLKGALSARKVVDVKGPMGWTYSAVSLGKLGDVKEADKGLKWCSRQVLPLLELRIPFTLKKWELDDISRGDNATDFAPLIEAAQALAKIEDEAVYHGLSEAGIAGMAESADNEALDASLDADSLVEAAAEAVGVLNARAVEGPYALVCCRKLWNAIQTNGDDYPLKKRLSKIVDSVILAPQSSVCMVVSLRGGDSELTLGQDIAVGYESSCGDDVKFYLTESFTFRVVAPESIVPLAIK